jgi:hypothetical protein
MYATASFCLFGKSFGLCYNPPLKILFSRLWLLGVEFWDSCNSTTTGVIVRHYSNQRKLFIDWLLRRFGSSNLRHCCTAQGRH